MSEIEAILPGVEEEDNTTPSRPTPTPEKKQKIEGADGSDEMETSKDGSDEMETSKVEEEEDEDSEEEREGGRQVRRRPQTEWWKEYEGYVSDETINRMKSGEMQGDSDSEYIPYGSEETEVDWVLWKQYYKQIKDTEGFGVNVFPGPCFNAYLRPIFDFKEYPLYNRLANELSDMAIKHFNTEHVKEFKLVDVEWMVEQPSRGLMFLLTFKAEDAKEGLKTFEAKVLEGINDEREVFMCRMKKQEAAP